MVPEVVREPRIFYYKVPRLGSYLAVKLEYDSCLLQSSFDSGVTDFLDMKNKVKDLEEDRKNFEEQQRELKEQKEADGEEFVPEVKEWPEVTAADYKTTKVQFVVCLNSLGQDREF